MHSNQIFAMTITGRDKEETFRKRNSKFDNLLSLIRWNEWQDVRIPFFFIVILYFQYVDRILGTGPSVYIKFFLLFLFSLCYYGFLFLTNDFFDYDQDVLSAKKNAKRSKKLMRSIIIILFLGSISFLVMSWNSLSIYTIVISSVGYAFTFFYSAPPLRFKEKGIWGILVGALVLRPTCILIALSGFSLTHGIIDIVIFFLWIEIFSVRTMLHHQIDDYHNDIKAGVQTFVTKKGVGTANKLISCAFLPAEAMMLIVVIGLLVLNISAMKYFLLVYTIFYVIVHLQNTSVTRKTFSLYRPFFDNFIFFVLPSFLAVLVAIKYSLWLIPILIIFWQRRFWSNLIPFRHSNYRIFNFLP